MSEQNTQREAAVQQQQAVAQSRNLNAELQILAKFGGFNVLESSVDGIQNMNPERKARRNIFLSDPERAAERKELEKRLEMWVDMLKATNPSARWWSCARRSLRRCPVCYPRTS